MKKTFIVLGILTVIFGALSVVSAFYTVNRAEKSIDQIGKITVDEDYTLSNAQKRLDKAIEDYNKLDKNIHLDDKIDNVNLLVEAKKEFVNISILLAYSVDSQKIKLNYDDSQVAEYVKKISDYQKAYISEEEFSELSEYATYQTLAEKYKAIINNGGSDNNGSGDDNGSQNEEIEIC